MGGWESWKDADNKPKTIGEALGVKGRNPIEWVHYKRKVTTARRGGLKKDRMKWEEK